MKVTLITDTGEFFVIKMKNPSKDELKEINKPEEQTTATEVWVDRKLNNLKKALLKKEYKYKF